ncbi:MAG: T9SS type A sorting domain-containing protein [candidate division Zixibacteria bacterium]|nr:T9SS type A sorting domain-containing protein [candidate division Zixibacteria bacterium]
MCRLMTFFGLAFLIILISIMPTDHANAQNKGAWVEYKLPGDRPANWSRMVGENCLIFVDRMAPEIYAFDIGSAEWHTYTASTDLDWSSQIKVGRNVAFVYNDEMVVAYNGLTQEFVPISYTGAMLPGTTYGHDCRADMAYFVTDQNFYVFDGEDNVWRTYDISDMGDVISWGMYGIEDYILFYASETGDYKKLVAYSYLTKTFAGYDGDGFIEHEELNHGFIFYKNMTPAADSVSHFFAGYSAFSGDYVLLERANSSAIWNSIARRGHPGTSAMFEDRYRIEDNNWKIDIFGFDTRHGNFVQTSYDYTYTCNDNCPYITEAGGEIAIATERIKDSGVLNHRVYNGTTNSFSSFISPLIYPTCSMSAIIAAGGIVYSSSDCSKVWFYDVEAELGISAGLPSIEGGYYNSIGHRMYDNWGIAECKRSLDSTVHIYSYHQDNNDQIHTFTFESASTFGRFDSTNVGGRMSNNIGGPYVLYLYSPGLDSWSSVDFGSSHAKVGKGVQRDYIFWYDTEISGPMQIFDGVTGVTTSMPFGWSYIYASHIVAKSNFMLTRSVDNIYSGYSTYTRTYSEYAGELMSGFRGQEDVLVMQKTISGGGANILVYNVLYDNFVMTNFDTEYGTYFDIWAGGKTALIMTLPGYLLAWDPNADASTDVEDNITDTNLPESYSLSQNYPNPFNPTTVISYSIPKRSDVSISIINLLGQKIKTIVNENQTAGKHTVNWDGTDQSGKAVASGIYFYQINAGDYTASKKMIMIK